VPRTHLVSPEVGWDALLLCAAKMQGRGHRAAGCLVRRLGSFGTKVGEKQLGQEVSASACSSTRPRLWPQICTSASLGHWTARQPSTSRHAAMLSSVRSSSGLPNPLEAVIGQVSAVFGDAEERLSGVAMQKGAEAVDAAMVELNALRGILHPHGYNLQNLYITLGVIPTVTAFITLTPNAQLDSIDLHSLTDVQQKVIWALRQKAIIEPTLEKHEMLLTDIRVVCTMPPTVTLSVGWKEALEPPSGESVSPPIADKASSVAKDTETD